MKLKDWRIKAKLNQEQLASRLNRLYSRKAKGKKISQESISLWEGGHHSPRKKQLLCIIALTKGEVTANDFI